MSHKRYPEQFKIEAVKQVTVAGHSVADVAQRLGTTTHSLYAWIKRYGPDSEEHLKKSAESAEIRRLQKELKRVTEERDCSGQLKLATILEFNQNSRSDSLGVSPPLY